MIHKIDISHKTTIFITVFILGIWITYVIKDLLILLFVALIFMSALSPVVNFITSFKVPKVLGIGITYIIIIAILATILATFLPPIIEQTTRLISVLPSLLKERLNLTGIDQTFLQSQLSDFSRNIFSVTLAVFDNIVTLIFLLVLTFYLLLERENLEQRVASLFVGREQRIKKLIVQIEDRLGAWVRGQVLLSLIIGLLVYLGLLILDVPYALPLALLAGVMEVIPVIGPIISAIPAIALGLSISPILAAGIGVMYFVIQQLENNLIVPQVMKRAVGLNPLVVILAVAVGSRLLGVGGALLAVPIVVVMQIVVSEILSEKKA